MYRIIHFKLIGYYLFIICMSSVTIGSPVFAAKPSSPANARIVEDSITGIWAFVVLDNRAESLLIKKDDYIDEQLQLRHPYVKGIAPRLAWSTLNPAPGEYNWASLDKIIERAAFYNKKVMIRVIGGGDPALTPAWVWSRIKSVDRQGKFGETGYKLPIIWDPEFLSAWTNFIKALGLRYDSNPVVQRVNINSGHIGELWYLIGDRMTDAQIHQVLDYGFADHFVPAWKSIIDSYVTAFPTKPMSIDLAKTVDKISFIDDNGMEGIITDYAASKLGTRLYIQQDGLSESTGAGGVIGPHLTIMNSYSIKGNITGFQTLEPWLHGDLKTAFERAMVFPIRYVEIFGKDLQDPLQQDAIRFLYERLVKTLTPLKPL